MTFRAPLIFASGRVSELASADGLIMTAVSAHVIISEVSILTDAATVAVDLSLGNNFSLDIAGNRTLGIPTMGTAGQSGKINIKQDSSGSRTLAYSYPFIFPGGVVPVLTTTALARDVLGYNVVKSKTSTVTISIANPGVITWTAHGLATGDYLRLTTTGALPTGLAVATTYWVIAVNANTFSLATSKANASFGTKITTTGSQSGVHTANCTIINASLVKDYR